MLKRKHIFLSIVCALALVAGGVFADELCVPYKVKVSGVHKRSLRKALLATSQAAGSTKTPPSTMARLSRRAEQDIPRMEAMLESVGYFEREVTCAIETNVSPVLVRYNVQTGPRYHCGNIAIAWRGDAPHPEPAIGLGRGDPAVAAEVIAEEQDLLHELKRTGYPMATAEKREVVLDPGTSQMHLTYALSAGPAARFGPVRVEGLTTVKDEYVLASLPWRQGRSYNIERVEELEEVLLRSGLFSSVRVQRDGEVDDQGLLSLAVGVSERTKRTIRVGANYRADVGFGAKVEWENRSLMRGGERLRAELSGNEIGAVSDVSLELPNILRPQLSLVYGARVAREQPEAYESINARGVIALKRYYREYRWISGGVGLKYSNVEQLGEAEYFNLLFFPLSLDWNTSNDLLDPQRGGRWRSEIAPYHNLAIRDLSFLRGNLERRGYHTFRSLESITLALRLTGGLIYGAGVQDVPADERFYAGGGGSVRGYAYQSVGPVAEDGTPLGGKSLIEVSGEVRYRMSRSLGAVAFVDGGSSFLDTVPDPDEALLWGVGGGLRYFTAIGPIRFDLAFPLNRRKDIDEHFYFYVSLGQAF